MSRWGRGRGGVAVPLDSALFRENSNCPTAARSAGTVGKWGITSFTSIRSAPFAYASSVQKKPVQDQNSPLTVPAVDSEQPPPKPKKFFKSRNTETLPPVPQILYAPPPPLIPLSPDRGSHSKGGKGKKGRSYTRDSSSPELAPKKSSEKSRGRKNSAATKAAKKEDTSTEDARPPNKRYLVRTRNKVVNYAEDGSNSPIPDFTRYEAIQPRLQPSPKPASPKPSPSMSSPTYVKPSLISPSSSKDDADDKKPPPIVLRISKGTSRIVSTDSNEGFTSPNSDRHSSMDMHSDALSDQKTSPTMETICSPKHEGLKITIKCAGLNQESSKKVKKKDKRDHKLHKKHHKNTDDESSKKHSSPRPGSDTYDLYKTLASPGPEASKPSMEEIESQLAELDSGPPAKSPKYDNDHHSKSPPEPKPPERSSGRSRRNRTKVNYNENDDYLDAVTSKRLIPKTVHELKKEVKKGKRRNEAPVAEVPDALETPETEEPTPIENSDLIDILSGADSETKKPESEPRKGKLHKKLKLKNIPKQVSPPPEEPDISTENAVQEAESADNEINEDVALSEIQKEIKADNIAAAENPNPQSPEAKLDNPVIETPDEGPKSPVPAFKPPQDASEEDATHSEEKPSVKLVITKKKGSIFKSKSLVSENSPLPARKRRHLYRHEWNDKGNETPRPETKPEEGSNAENASGEIPDELIRVTRYRAPDPMMDGMDAGDSVKPYTSVKCSKEAKEYYTVVRNVKKAHQIQEIGEFQEFNDDVDYLLDACQDNNPISTRCLSAITLATKCTAAAFRMHLRAHGTVQKFFSALHDATNDQSLGLCTATVMFVLSQDRLNMDLDRESLELMLNLLESDASHKNALDDCGLTSAQLTKTQERVRELCAEIKNQGKAKDLDLDNITVGHLAMETLLSLTSKRAGEWFKEELRALGGIDHIVKTIQDCVLRLQPPTTQWPPQNVDVLRKADRCMRVLENVTQQNEENQLYLISGGRERVCETLATLLSVCVSGLGAQLSLSPLQTALLDAALPALKVLVNLSHSSHANALLGANVVGQQVSVMENCLILLNNQNNFVPDDRNFEFSVCVLLLLINLVQNNEANADRLLNIRVRVDSDADIMAARIPALELIVQLFYKREDLAKRAEENTDALLDNQVQPDKDKKKQSQDDIDETVAKLLARAGTHMEHTMCGAYIALLLGHIAVASPTLAASVRQRVESYAPLLPTLTKYYKFLSLTASAEATIVAHVKATHRIIKFMETSDQEHDPTPPASHQVNNVSHSYYQTSPSDMPQDMSINNLTYNNSYSSSSSDRMSSSMEVDSYH